MKTFKHIALAFTALLLVTSCAIDEMWEGMDTQDEEKVLTFKPKFEDFEAVTKAIGKGEKVDQLLVQVYEQGQAKPISSETYEKPDWSTIAIPFYYGKKYEVYFWAYNSENDPYTIGENGLKDGVSVEYPDRVLSYDALEILDAFYAVKSVDLSSDNESKVDVSLTRPFAQVNFVADKQQLANAMATEVIFEVPVSKTFTPGQNPVVGNCESLKFTFKDSQYFQKNEVFATVDGQDIVYLGTSYIFVDGTTSIDAYVTLCDKAGAVLKKRTKVGITLDANCRTNLTFSGIEPAWDNEAMGIPDVAGDGWIHISKPEELAQLLITGTDSETKVHICNDIDLGGLPADVKAKLGAKPFQNLTIDGGKYENDNMSGELLGGSYMIKNMTASSFLGTATNLTVRNLNIDNLQISATTGHVGTLVNTLKGTSSFTNVTVSNSSATTTNGAAGGMVGYIERITPTDRLEKLNVTFTNCQVNGSTEKSVADGSDAEGKFVGLLSGYDNGETLTFDASCSAGVNTGVADYVSSYTAPNQSCFLTATDSKYDQYLGSERNRRGAVNYGTQRIVPKWDGTTVVKPIITSETQFDGLSAGVVVYSPYDLAWFQNQDYNSANVYLRSHLDMGGTDSDDAPTFEPILSMKFLDGLKKGLSEFSSFDDCYKIHNLKVVKIHSNGNGAAFILTGTNSQIHQNLVFEKSSIISKHDDTITNIDDSNYGNAYAGTIVCKVEGAYTVKNVLIYNGSVSGVCKMGGLLGYCTGNLSAINCNVDKCTITNYDPQCINWYYQKEQISSMIAYAKDSFYTDGEVGGLIGFITSSSPTIKDCSVTNTVLDCTGEANKSVSIGVYNADGFDENNLGSPLIRGKVTIAGRHVNQFIGDIRTTKASNTISIINPYVSNNSYKRDSNDHFYSDITTKTLTKQWTEGKWLKKYYRTYNCTTDKKYTSIVGCAYVVAVTVELLGKHVGDEKGVITINNSRIDPDVTTTTQQTTGDETEWTGILPETWECTYSWINTIAWNPAGESSFNKFIGDDFSM